jgi:hypothetical protein
MACTANEKSCAGQCVNTLGDVLNCGACGIVCLPGERCAGGICLGTTGAGGAAGVGGIGGIPGMGGRGGAGGRP